MRCSTVSGLFEVAAAAAGGLAPSFGAAAVWADAWLKQAQSQGRSYQVLRARAERPAVFEKDEVILSSFSKRKWPLSR